MNQKVYTAQSPEGYCAIDAISFDGEDTSECKYKPKKNEVER